MKLLFIDIETTGFGRKYDQIIEAAAIMYDDETEETSVVFHQYARPKKPIPWNITEITGITDEMVADADDEKELIRELSEFIHVHMPDALVGHNSDSFDVPWIREKAFKYFLPWFNTPTAEAKKPTDLAHHREVTGMFRDSITMNTIDTLKIAKREKFPSKMFTKGGNPSYKQEAIAFTLGIEYEAHSAIEDVKALIKIYKHLFKTKDQKRTEAGF